MKTAVYCRVSTREQGDSGLGLAAQKARCMAEITSRGWSLATLVEEQASLGRRRSDKFKTLLRTMELGHAEALMVSRLDRLSRSVVEFGKLVALSQEQGWALVILEPAIDLSTPTGRMIGHVIASVAQWEREMGAQRTADALAAKRARGETWGIARYDDKTTIRRICRLRVEKSMSMEAIAEWLTDSGVPTPSGNPAWNHKMISVVLKREGVK